MKRLLTILSILCNIALCVYGIWAYGQCNEVATIIVTIVSCAVSLLLLFLSHYPNKWIHVGNVTYDDMNEKQKRNVRRSMLWMSVAFTLVFAVIITNMAGFLPKGPAILIVGASIFVMIIGCALALR